MLVVDPVAGRFEARVVGDLARFVNATDLLVVNDAATFPASLRGATPAGEPVEARLLVSAAGTWRAVLFGAGDWRTRTEDRPPPPRLREGDRLVFPGGLEARVASVARESPRLVALAFEGTSEHVWSAIHRHGRPIQYAHIDAPLAPWHVQTPFASRPWASEMPSAARPLAWELVLAIRSKGARFASVTHAAGLSSTGDAELDARLPLRESFEVPLETAGAIPRTRAAGGRIVAVGTSAVRALESAARMHAPSGETDLIIDERHALASVDALFTGMHEPGTSHDDLLHAFAPAGLLADAYAHALDLGFVGHEFGDSMLIARGALGAGAG
jgi:S-adenosylmethionine:tRNA ribosyltransferase-isomerase